MMANSDVIVQGLVAAGLPEGLVDELIGAFSEAKRNHHLAGHRLAAVEGGRFCEAAYRLLEESAWGESTPLGKQLDTEKLSQRLASLPAKSTSDSIRLHIPRTLRVVYDIRNRRDAAHLADGIDPNTQDSALVVACISWVMAEFVRLFHDVAADEAEVTVNHLVTRDVPAIQEFDGAVRVLGGLQAGDTCLLLLYRTAPDPMTIDGLCSALRPSMRPNIVRTLKRLDGLDLVHQDVDRIWITRVGERHVEQGGLADYI